MGIGNPVTRQVLHLTVVILHIILIGLQEPFIGWIYDTGIWYKFGLSDTAPITSKRYAGVTHYGIGEAPDANNRMRDYR